MQVILAKITLSKLTNMYEVAQAAVAHFRPEETPQDNPAGFPADSFPAARGSFQAHTTRAGNSMPQQQPSEDAESNNEDREKGTHKTRPAHLRVLIEQREGWVASHSCNNVCNQDQVSLQFADSVTLLTLWAQYQVEARLRTVHRCTQVPPEMKCCVFCAGWSGMSSICRSFWGAATTAPPWQRECVYPVGPSPSLGTSTGDSIQAPVAYSVSSCFKQYVPQSFG